MKTLISTDTSCLINYDSLKKYDISVFPLNVIIDGEEFLDGITINQDELKDAMRSNKKIKTSTPPLGEVIEYFEKLFEKGYDHIIHFTISSKLSSMNQLFNNVAEEYFKGKITVIDSYGLSTTMLSHVFYAYDEAKKGTEISEIVKNIEERKINDYIVFIPENLVALKNGGRISPSVALIGNMLGIKPLLNLTDGELKKESMVKNSKKALADKLDNLTQKLLPSEYDYTFIDFDGNANTVNWVCEYAEKLGLSLNKGIIPINVCAHCGPGTIGLVVSKKINDKSLKDFIN
ncbi:MAG: DegV family protein [Clostridiales bacterium]|nr:DegV family protein [Clostridiales bacterium]